MRYTVILTLLVLAACGGPTDEEQSRVIQARELYTACVTAENTLADCLKMHDPGSERYNAISEQLEEMTDRADGLWDEIHSYYIRHHDTDHNRWQYHQRHGIRPRPRY